MSNDIELSNLDCLFLQELECLIGAEKFRSKLYGNPIDRQSILDYVQRHQHSDHYQTTMKAEHTPTRHNLKMTEYGYKSSISTDSTDIYLASEVDPIIEANEKRIEELETRIRQMEFHFEEERKSLRRTIEKLATEKK